MRPQTGGGEIRNPDTRGITVAFLIIDSDLGFVFWLGQALDAAGYKTLPAMNVQGASALIEEYELTVTLVIIDPASPEAGAFLRRLRGVQPWIKAIAAITPETPATADLTVFDGVMTKAEGFTSGALRDWIVMIERLMRRAGVSRSVS